MDTPKYSHRAQLTRVLLCMAGLALTIAACTSSNTSVTGLPTLEPTYTPILTAVLTAIPTPFVVMCNASQDPYFSPSSGQLPPHIPLPPNSLISPPSGIPGSGETDYSICTPSDTPSSIVSFMNSALQANGWKPNTTTKSCYREPPYQWYQGAYGIIIGVPLNRPDTWSGLWNIGICSLAYAKL